MMIKSRSKKFHRAISFKFGGGGGGGGGGCINIWCGGSNNKVVVCDNIHHHQKGNINISYNNDKVIKWELRPGGMLVQKRDKFESGNNKIATDEEEEEEMIIVRVSSTGSQQWHHISIQATSTFGEMKMILSLVTNLEPREQRLVFKGKEREDKEYLHMVGVRDKDKVLLLEDPAIKERKLHGLTCRTTISV